EGAAGGVVGDRAVDGVGRVVPADGGDDDAVVLADGVERGVDAGVEGAGADVGALERGERDAGVVEDLGDRDRGRDDAAAELAGGGGERGVGAVLRGLGEDFGDVPVGVVVREDRSVVVARGAGGAEVAGGGGDGVGRVVDVLAPVVVAVDAVAVPGAAGAEDGELHRAGAAAVGVDAGVDAGGGGAAVVGLDGADAGQDPGVDAVAGAGLLVEGEVGRGDLGPGSR